MTDAKKLDILQSLESGDAICILFDDSPVRFSRGQIDIYVCTVIGDGYDSTIGIELKDEFTSADELEDSWDLHEKNYRDYYEYDILKIGKDWKELKDWVLTEHPEYFI